MDTLLSPEGSTFYEQLKNCKALDLRDNRGKTHCIGLVLIGVLIGLYRNRDGVLSSIHRSIKNTHFQLCSYLKIDYCNPVSRAQLPIILKKVEVIFFSNLLFSFLGVELSDEEKQWFAGDGKELRGSISKGEKRGDVVVQAVSHKDRTVYGQAFYNGQKESERPCIRELFDNVLGGQKITLDALHLIPETLKQIEKQAGIYVVGLKENQKELYDDMAKLSQTTKPINETKETEKGHGRIDKRTYRSYAIEQEYFDQRWTGANFQTLVEVERISIQYKSKIESKEVSYYISNATIKDKNDDELFKAIRGHWNVETNNYIRDVTFKEDALKTGESTISKLMASCRTLVLNLLTKLKPKNIKAKLEDFADNFKMLLQWLTEVKIL